MDKPKKSPEQPKGSFRKIWKTLGAIALPIAGLVVHNVVSDSNESKTPPASCSRVVEIGVGQGIYEAISEQAPAAFDGNTADKVLYDAEAIKGSKTNPQPNDQFKVLVPDQYCQPSDIENLTENGTPIYTFRADNAPSVID